MYRPGKPAVMSAIEQIPRDLQLRTKVPDFAHPQGEVGIINLYYHLHATPGHISG